MRTFACFVFQRGEPTPNLTFVLTGTLQRAREIVRREFLGHAGAQSVEICEGARLLCTEAGAEPPAAS